MSKAPIKVGAGDAPNKRPMKDLQVLDDKSNNEISINEIEEEEKGIIYLLI